MNLKSSVVPYVPNILIYGSRFHWLENILRCNFGATNKILITFFGEKIKVDDDIPEFFRIGIEKYKRILEIYDDHSLWSFCCFFDDLLGAFCTRILSREVFVWWNASYLEALGYFTRSYVKSDLEVRQETQHEKSWSWVKMLQKNLPKSILWYAEETEGVQFARATSLQRYH